MIALLSILCAFIPGLNAADLSCDAIVADGNVQPFNYCISYGADESMAYFCTDDGRAEAVVYDTGDCTGTPYVSAFQGSEGDTTVYCPGTTCTLGTLDVYSTDDCSGDTEESTQVVLGQCSTDSGSSQKYECDGDAMTLYTYATYDCSGTSVETDLSQCYSGAMGSCEAVDALQVSHPSESAGNAEPYTDDYDPGCNAVSIADLGLFYPVDACLSSGDTSFIYECNVYGGVSVITYDGYDCSGLIEATLHDLCGSVGEDECKAYCANSNSCKETVEFTSYESRPDCSGQADSVNYFVAGICGQFNGTNSRRIDCGATEFTATEWRGSAACGGEPFNVTTLAIDECDGDEEYESSIYYSCVTFSSSAFAVSKVVAVILSVVGFVYFV